MRFSIGQTAFVTELNAKATRPELAERSPFETELVRVPVIVRATFVGRKGEEWYAYEHPDEKGGYGLLPGTRLYESATVLGAV